MLPLPLPQNPPTFVPLDFPPGTRNPDSTSPWREGRIVTFAGLNKSCWHPNKPRLSGKKPGDVRTLRGTPRVQPPPLGHPTSWPNSALSGSPTRNISAWRRNKKNPSPYNEHKKTHHNSTNRFSSFQQARQCLSFPCFTQQMQGACGSMKATWVLF